MQDDIQRRMHVAGPAVNYGEERGGINMVASQSQSRVRPFGEPRLHLNGRGWALRLQPG